MVRPFLKIRLTDNQEAWEAMGVMGLWRNTRQLARNLPRAVIIYEALLKGDTAKLAQYFPFLVDALRGNNGAYIRPKAGILNSADVEISYVEKSEAEDVADLLDGMGW